MSNSTKRSTPTVSALATVACTVAALLLNGPDAVAAGGALLGLNQFHVIAKDDTVPDLARRYGVGFVEMMAANPGVDPWVPTLGRELVVPAAHLLPDGARRGILINLSELRLYYFGPDGTPLFTAPIGIGREGQKTPLGQTRVVAKKVKPTWFPPASVRRDKPELPAVVPPGPDNPLGDYGLYLGWARYIVHGTNKPYGVGRRVSRGCVRMYPEDIEKLFAKVQVGTPVTVVDQPVKLGWSGGRLYVEVHPTQTQVDEIEENGHFSAAPIDGLKEKVAAAAGAAAATIDWDAVNRAATERRGIPVAVTG